MEILHGMDFLPVYLCYSLNSWLYGDISLLYLIGLGLCILARI